MKIIIPTNGLMTLNQYTSANRRNKFGGARKKKEATQICALHTKKAMNEGFKFHAFPVNLQFDWYAKDRRSDKDNIAFMRKFVFDGWIKAGLLDNDGWQEIGNWTDNFHIDKDNPRVEIKELEE
ncbi:MAG: hypothetical protein L0J65_01950 [Alkalibacterium sp.]|nr:hypothetical protein [Alkalibacterium sp.]